MNDCVRIRSSTEAGSDSGIEDPSLLSEESDVVPHTIVRSSELSPRHRRPSWDARYPKTIYETSMATALTSASHLQLPQVRNRRMSDPGLKAPRSTRARACDVREQRHEEDDEFDEHAPVYATRRSSLTTLHTPLARTALATRMSRSRERASSSGALPPLVRRSQRSFSLPNSDGVVMEINEAVGALAISRVPIEKPTVRIEPSPDSHMHHTDADVIAKHSNFSAKFAAGVHAQVPSILLMPPAAGACVRRRSLSIEPSGLEAIEEEAGCSRYSRRYSTPQLER